MDALDEALLDAALRAADRRYDPAARMVTAQAGYNPSARGASRWDSTWRAGSTG